MKQESLAARTVSSIPLAGTPKRRRVVTLSFYFSSLLVTAFVSGLLVYFWMMQSQSMYLLPQSTGAPSPLPVATTPAPEASVKTYMVDQYGLTFSYPDSWEVILVDKAMSLGASGPKAGPDLIPCTPENKRYFKSLTPCAGKEVTAVNVVVRDKTDPSTGSQNELHFSVMQFGLEQEPKGDTFDSITKDTIIVDGNTVKRTNWSIPSELMVNDGFYVRGIKTGSSSQFTSVNAYAVSRNLIVDDQRTLEIAQEILQSITTN